LISISLRGTVKSTMNPLGCAPCAVYLDLHPMVSTCCVLVAPRFSPHDRAQWMLPSTGQPARSAHGTDGLLGLGPRASMRERMDATSAPRSAAHLRSRVCSPCIQRYRIDRTLCSRCQRSVPVLPQTGASQCAHQHLHRGPSAQPISQRLDPPLRQQVDDVGYRSRSRTPTRHHLGRHDQLVRSFMA
jgi:hypothetical protein